jgi:hypothetical protein
VRTDAASRPIDPLRALDVLGQLARELGEVDADTRAIVGLRAGVDGGVELVDVTLRDNGVLEVADDVAGLVVVTSEQLAHGEDIVVVHQQLCVLPDGTEVGTTRIAGSDELRTFRTDEDPDDAADALRPRDIASNTARRAFGLPSLVDPCPEVTDVLARAWLVTVAAAALAHFDTPDGPAEVTAAELAEVAARPLPGGFSVDGPIPTWAELHHAAADGHLEVGPFSADREHAAWLDPAGLAQVLDRTLPTVDELLGSLEVVGDDDLIGWAIGWLAARDWYQPD